MIGAAELLDDARRGDQTITLESIIDHCRAYRVMLLEQTALRAVELEQSKAVASTKRARSGKRKALAPAAATTPASPAAKRPRRKVAAYKADWRPP